MKSKGVKKCFGLLSVLFIMVGLSLSVSSGFVNAVQYDIVSVPYFSPNFPSSYSLDSSSGNYLIDWEHFSDSDIAFSPVHFSIYFEGDSYKSSYSTLNSSSSLSTLGVYSTSLSGQCFINHLGIYPDLTGTFNYVSYSDSLFINSRGTYFDSRVPAYLYNNDSLSTNCQYRLPFGSSPQGSFDSSDPGFSGFITCGRDNGAVCGGTWDFRNFLRTQLLPYYYTSDGFYRSSTAVDSQGFHYNHTFSFSDMFNQQISGFSYLSIPLFTYDEFWLDGNSLTQGRQLEFKGSFNFTEPYSFHENINSNGSSFSVLLSGFNPLTESVENFTFNCSTRNISIPETSVYSLEYSCSGSLPDQYTWLYPVLIIDGNSNYFWTTSGDTIFASSVLITDNDSTPAGVLGDNLSGNYIIGYAGNYISSDDNTDWFQSLINLFSFGFVNPFAPIFQLFTDNSTCASIPTIAGMIHSNETTICPWFSSSTRSILTPVLGLSSMMLVFGFAVRWLGSGSGNMLEDSVGHDWGDSHFQSKFSRRSKK